MCHPSRRSNGAKARKALQLDAENMKYMRNIYVIMLQRETCIVTLKYFTIFFAAQLVCVRYREEAGGSDKLEKTNRPHTNVSAFCFDDSFFP